LSLYFFFLSRSYQSLFPSYRPIIFVLLRLFTCSFLSLLVHFKFCSFHFLPAPFFPPTLHFSLSHIFNSTYWFLNFSISSFPLSNLKKRPPPPPLQI
jgi:hypothetical protein